jgi:hypothetical protein
MFEGGLNPGFIQPTPFYRTNDPAQSKFYWGGHGYQYGPTFNAQEYNRVAAPNTPFGLQQLAKPLTGQEITDVISGRPYVSGPVAPATRMEQYVPDTRTPPSYGQVKLNPTYTGATQTPARTASPNYSNVSQKLGDNWFNKQQAFAMAGDWDAYNDYTQQINNILNPPTTTVKP